MSKKNQNNEQFLQSYHCEIFRFCDRWCEKCNHTENCFYFNLITQSINKEINIDKKSLEFIIKSGSSNIYSKRTRGINVLINFDNLSFQDIKSESDKSFQTVIYSKLYSRHVNNWFSSLLDCEVDPTFKKYSSAGCFKSSLKELKSSIEIIRRYQDLISSRIEIALSYRYLKNENFEKGYSKLSIDLVEESLKAWIKLYNVCTANKDKSLEIIKHLEELLIMIKESSPGANSYYRVGHD